MDETRKQAPNLSRLVDELLGCYRELRRHLLHRLRDPDDAADIAQSSFERVYAHALSLPLEDAAAIRSPRALLYRTAKNLCVDLGRHNQVVDAWHNDRANVAEQFAPSSEEVLIHREAVERVIARLQTLPARRREVYLLFRVYGHTKAEIAHRLGITEAAVAKHLVRATVDCARVFAYLNAEALDSGVAR